MASIYGDYSKNVRLRIDYSVTSQSIENNTSTIRLDLYAEKTAHSGYNKTGKSYFNMTGRGNTTVNWDWGSSSSQYFLGSSDVTVSHNADGTGSTTLNGYWYLATSSSYMPTEVSVSGSITLPTIPRASSIGLSPSSLKLGTELSIAINRASSSFRHALYWQIDSGDWHLIEAYATSSYKWTVPKDLANYFTSSTSKTIRIICETYNGDTYIGNSSQTFTANISDDIVPTISSLTLSDPTGNSVYIETISSIKAKTVANGAYGSSITNIAVSMIVNGATKKTLYGSEVTFDLNNLNITENTTVTINAIVTDSRGKINIATKTVTVYRYIKPYVMSRNSFRCNANGTRYENGTYLSLYWVYHVSTSVTNNVAKPKVQYRQKGSSEWTTVNLGNGATSVVGDGAISTDYEYEVQYIIGDNYYSNISITDTIPTGYTTVDYRAGGKGIAFGKVSEKDEFECNMPADFKKSISWNSKDTSNVDANDYTKAGMYYLGENCSNLPNSYCRLIVNGAESSGDIVQMAIAVTTGRTWIRGKSNGNWHNWNEVPLSNYAGKVNLNEYKNPGVFGVYNATNAPTTDIAVLEVIKYSEDWIAQRFNIISHEQYTRTYERCWHNGTTWSSWQQIFRSEKMLYVNDSGSSGTITLSESAAHFSIMDIYAMNNDGKRGYTRVFYPHNKDVTLDIATPSYPTYYGKAKGYTISGTSITLSMSSRTMEYYFANGTTTNSSNSNSISIYKVIGYR